MSAPKPVGVSDICPRTRCVVFVVVVSLGSLLSSSQKVSAEKLVGLGRIFHSITRLHALLTSYGRRQAKLLDWSPPSHSGDCAGIFRLDIARI